MPGYYRCSLTAPGRLPAVFVQGLFSIGCCNTGTSHERA
jgi:hypothetical protein